MRAKRLSLGAMSVAAMLLLLGCIPPSLLLSDADREVEELFTAEQAASEESEAPAESAEPSTRALVQQAVAGGDLDEHTGLLYRLWGQFHDPQLPEAYRSKAPAHDNGVLRQLTRGLESLPDEVAEQVRPYLLRPTDPGSAFSSSSGGGPGVGDADGADVEGSATAEDSSGADEQVVGAQRASIGLGTPAAGQQPEESEESEATDELEERQCQDWETMASDQVPFRVWVCESFGDSAAVTEAMGLLVGLLDEYTPDMMKAPDGGMGEPVRDRPNLDPHDAADDKIDLYVLDADWFGPDRYTGREEPLVHGHVAVVDNPFRGTTSSGYMLFNAADVKAAMDRGTDSWERAELDRAVVHEVFHILQFAHNYTAPQWFAESTATWAEHFYVDHSFRVHHEQHLATFQPHERSLLSNSSDGYPYDAYLWALFMEQEAFAAEGAIFDVWRQLNDRANPSHQDVLDIIDQHIFIQQEFSEFAMRVTNLNPSGEPIETRFVHLTEDFPDGASQPGAEHHLSDGPVEIDHTGLPGLARQTHQVFFDAPPDREVGIQVTPDFEDSGRPTVEALVRDEHGDYRRKELPAMPVPTTFCSAGTLALIVSNSDMDPAATLEGTTTVEQVTAAGCDLAGDLQLTYDDDYHSGPSSPAYDFGTTRWRGTLFVELGDLEPENPVRAELHELYDLPDPPMIYPGTGSRWIMSGHYRYERCSSLNGGACPGHIVRQELRGHSVLAGHPDDDGAHDNGWLYAIQEDDGVELRGHLPVTVTTHHYKQATRVTKAFVRVKCNALTPEYGNGFNTGGGLRDPRDSSTRLVGTWTDESQTTLTFDCAQSFTGAGDRLWGSGERNIEFTVRGSIDVN